MPNKPYTNDSFCCFKHYPPRAPVDGWYRVSLIRDDHNAYDPISFKKDGSHFGLDNHYFEREIPGDDLSPLLLKTIGTYGSPDLYRSIVQNTDTLHADRFKTAPGPDYRCQLRFDWTTRTWTRLDDSGYMLYPVDIHAPSPSQGADIDPNINSCSLGVCVNDPRFLVTITSKQHYSYNHSGQYPEFPKLGYIWLFAGETIDGI
jgi:hypothetical protein